MSGNYANMPIIRKKLRTSEDADGDSTMHSSPDFAADDDEMFPDEGNGPSTPRNYANFALDPSSELSPPNSQGPSSHVPRDGNLPTRVAESLNQNGKRTLAPTSASTKDSVQTDPETGYQWFTQEEAPGYAWKNSRAKEDEQRAWEQIIQKGDMIRSE
jgi:hypothetical protein